MALQLSTTVQDARLDAIETAIGETPTLKIFTGSAPSNCATADSGTLLAKVTLPSDWMADASDGAKAGSGLPWTESSADGTGTAGYFRIYDSSSTCHVQGTITATDGGGDMTLDNTSLASGQEFSVTNFTLTDGNS